MNRTEGAYAVIGLLDPEHRFKIAFSGLLCGVVLVVVLSPLFTDLFQALALRSPWEEMRRWGPVVAGTAAALLVTLAGVAAGAPSTSSSTWWRGRKVRVTAMLLCLGVAIALARFSKGVTLIRSQRLTSIEQARVDLDAARRILTESDEAKSIVASISEADRLIALGTRKRFPKIRRHGFRLRAEAREAQSELKGTAEKTIAEAQARLRELPSPHEVPTIEVLRVIAGPALTELVFAELGAVVMAFWASVACAPIRRRKWSDVDVEYDEQRFSRASGVEPRPEPSILSEEVEDAKIEDGSTRDRMSQRHPNLRGVDYQDLDWRTLEGLDDQRGEWHTLPLRRPALRRVGTRKVLWPVISVDDEGPSGRIVFAGSRDAHALLPQRVLDELAARFRDLNQPAPQDGDASSSPVQWFVRGNEEEEPN